MDQEKLTLRRLPSLNALRAVEAVARHGSIVPAARELHVTPAAVSQQVHQLEDWLGVELFQRGKQLVATDAARRALPLLTQGFDALQQAVDAMRSRDDEPRLVVSMPPVFAHRWLVPRLGQFRGQHPQIELQLLPTRRLVDLDAENIDLAVRFGSGRFPGLHSERLMPETVVLVAAPEVAARIVTPQDLCNEVLLYDESRSWDPVFPDWRDWLAGQGLETGQGVRLQHLGDTNLVIQAALNGLGVALAWNTLVADEVERGALVRLLGLSLPSARAYYLVVPSYRLGVARVEAFRQWLMAQAAQVDAPALL